MTQSPDIPESILDGELEATPSSKFTDDKLSSELSSWGSWMLGFGVLNLILSAFNSAFGVLLLLVGVASFYLHSSAMLMVIGITLSWAAVSNLASIFSGGSFEGLFWSAVQLWLAYQVFGKYRGFRRHEQRDGTDDDSPASSRIGRARAERLMPWIAAAVGLLAPLGFAAVFVSVTAWYAFLGESEPPQSVFTVMFTFAEIGVLGFAFGVAGWLAGYRRRLLSAIGIGGGLIMILAETGLYIMGSLLGA